MTTDDRFAKQRIADELEEPVTEAGNLARSSVSRRTR